MNRSIPLKFLLLVAGFLSLLLLCGALLLGYQVIGEVTTVLNREAERETPASVADAMATPAGQAQSGAQPGGQPLTLGPSTELLAEAVGPAGATLVVTAPGEALDQLTIAIPPGAYPAGTTVRVRSRPVEAHTFGPYFTPASPLLEIEAGPELAEGLVSITIPARVAPDEFGMVFAYEETSGRLEGLTPGRNNPDAVQIVTRYLSREMIVSKVRSEFLEGDIETGFQHGQDDWQFVNLGSVLAPSGHCAGQSLSAMYYFVEELGPPLYGQYDNYDHPFPPDTPGLQWDDELAYRLATLAQTTIDWDAASRWYWELFADEHGDRGVFNAFSYSMLLTGDPQFVGIHSSTGSGHAMIVYGKRGDSLLVSDPNYPFTGSEEDAERTIEFSSEFESFDPYYSGPNARDLGVPFETIVYFGYKDIIDWAALGTLWHDLEAGVIGGGQFPSFRLMVREEGTATEEELWNNHDATGDEILVRVEAEFAPYLFVYDAGGKKVREGSGLIRLPLVPGENELGFEINALDDDGNPYWVGFEWVKVRYEGAPEAEYMEYEGEWSTSIGGAGDFTLILYATGEAKLSLNGTPFAGTHANGRFEIEVSDSLTATGSYDETGVSGRAADENQTLEFSGLRVR